MNVRKSGVTDNKKHQTLVPEPSSSSKLISLGNHFNIFLFFKSFGIYLFKTTFVFVFPELYKEHFGHFWTR